MTPSEHSTELDSGTSSEPKSATEVQKRRSVDLEACSIPCPVTKMRKVDSVLPTNWLAELNSLSKCGAELLTSVQQTTHTHLGPRKSCGSYSRQQTDSELLGNSSTEARGPAKSGQSCVVVVFESCSRPVQVLGDA